MKASKWFVGILSVVLVCGLAAVTWFRFRGPVVGPSPYETVNDFPGEKKIFLTLDRETYPTDVEELILTVRNDAPDGVVTLSAHSLFTWFLEKQVDGVWHSMRTMTGENPEWILSIGFDSGPSGTVNWDGGEDEFVLPVSSCYATPLEAGTYRVVFPDSSYKHSVRHLAVEFEVK